MDFDDAFLQGLRPEMNHMNFHQKLFFKRRVYDLLGEIFEDRNRASSQIQINGQMANSSPTSLQHLGLLARTGALQLPKLAPLSRFKYSYHCLFNSNTGDDEYCQERKIESESERERESEINCMSVRVQNSTTAISPQQQHQQQQLNGSSSNSNKRQPKSTANISKFSAESNKRV